MYPMGLNTLIGQAYLAASLAAKLTEVHLAAHGAGEG